MPTRSTAGEQRPLPGEVRRRPAPLLALEGPRSTPAPAFPSPSLKMAAGKAVRARGGSDALGTRRRRGCGAQLGSSGH